MQERIVTTGKQRIRMLCYSYAVLWVWCAPLFIIDLMDIGHQLVALGFLVAMPICIVVVLEALYGKGRSAPGRGSSRAFLAQLSLFLMMASVAVHACWPTLYIRFFFWRHEQQFQRIVDHLEASSRVTRYQSGTVIWYRWNTISDVAIAFVHEPGRRPGDALLSREVTPLYPSGIAFDLHLGGPWYAARY